MHNLVFVFVLARGSLRGVAAVVSALALAARLRGGRGLDLALGVGGHLAGHHPVTVQSDGERARVRVARIGDERLDRAGVLVAVVHAVAFRIGLVRVVAGLEFAEVVEPVSVLVALGLLDLQRQVVTALPAIGDPVVRPLVTPAVRYA